MSIGKLTIAYRAVVDAIPKYEEARAFAEGLTGEVSYLGHEIEVLVRAASHDDDLDPECNLNFCRLVIEAVTDRLEIASVTGESDKQTELLNDVWAANDLGINAPDLMWGACRDGDHYASVSVADDVDFPEPEDIVITVLDPETVHVEYDRDTGTEKLWVSRVWDEPAGYDTEGNAVMVTRLTIWTHETIERWVTRPWVSGSSHSVHGDEDFVPYIEEAGDDNVLPNESGVIPIIHFRPSRPGRPLHRDAYSPARGINTLSAGLMVAVNFDASPQKWAISDDSQRNMFEQDPLVAGEQQAPDRPPNLESGPGKVWWLRNVKAVGQFANATPASYLDPMHAFIRWLGTLTSTPMHLLDLSGTAFPSGESQRAAEAPLRKRCGRVARLFTASWAELFELALDLLGQPGPVTITWAPFGTYDDSDALDNVSKQIALGIPFKYAVMSMGIPEALADVWSSAVDESQDEPMSIDRVERLAEMVQKVYLGVGPVLSIDEARDMLIAAGARISTTPPAGLGPTPPPALPAG